MMYGRVALLALALMVTACGPAKKTDAPPPKSPLMIKAERDHSVRVIARFASVQASAGTESMRAAALADVAAMGVPQAAPLGENMPFIVADVTPDQLRALTASPRFDLVVEDRLARPSLAESVPLVQGPQVWALGGRGAGQSVAILDTGVDSAHPFLAKKVVAEACFSTTSAASGAVSACPDGHTEQTGLGAARPCEPDECSHGTHVAGIAAGKGATFSGVAPDASIVAVQVFSKFVDRPGGPSPCAESGQSSPCVASFTSDQIRALDFVRQQAATRAIASVNMSLGGGRATTPCDEDFAKPVIDQLRAAGVAVAIAAGNEGFPDAVSFPGCISTAVTVGSTTKSDTVSSFSNRGPLIDLYAPGSSIKSSVPGGGFAVFSGTSMATPHVAGAFAALKSARPKASVDDIERALESTGVTVDGHPRIALLAALKALPMPEKKETPPMVAAAAEDAPRGIAALAALPEDKPVRVMARVRIAPGRTATESVQIASEAARTAGAQQIQAMPGQTLIVVEAKPAQLRALMKSGAIESIQVDRASRPQ